MSKSNTFYSRIKIKKDQLQNFLLSTPKPFKDLHNWKEWWDEKDMNKREELSLDYLNNNLYMEPIYSIVRGWVDCKESLSFSEYDELSETWHFGIIMFTEKNTEIIGMISALMNISDYIENDENNCIIIYSFIEESNDPVTAFLKFSDKSIYFTKPSKIELKAINSFLHQKYEMFRNE